MRIFLALVSCIIASISTASHAEQQLVIGRDIFVFHAQEASLIGGGVIQLLEPNKQTDYDMRALALLTGIEVSPHPWEVPDLPFVAHRALGINNAYAGIGIRDRMRYIIYDPELFADEGGGAGSRYWALAHELGHHACGHTDGSHRSNSWQQELEADLFSGAALRRLEQLRPALSFAREFAVARRVFPAQGTATHPPADQRIAAILNGYRNGSPCSMQNMSLYVPK